MDVTIVAGFSPWGLVLAHVSRGIYDGQSGTGTGFSLSALAFHCQYHSTVAFCPLMHHLEIGQRVR
jgi:hypothetical protein